MAWLLGLGLILLTVACYWRVGSFGYVILDDPGEVSANQMIQQGLTGPSIAWAFKTVATSNWQPLTALSHMLVCQLWGLNAGKHHLLNLLLHSANVLLLFLVLRRLTGSLWRSAFVAALLGWHPMHVESVAWISERKDVLSGLFFLLTLWAYGEYVGEKSRVQSPKSKVANGGKAPGSAQQATRSRQHAALWYALSLVLFALGLMSKPMVVTLPFVLLLLDYWPLGRVKLGSKHEECRSQRSTARGLNRAPARPSVLSLLLEKVPFFALSVADCVVTLIVQKHAGAVAPLGMVPVWLRVENALTSYVVYLGKFFWPGKMAALYLLPQTIPLWQVAGAGLVLGGVTMGVVWRVRAQPWLAVGWCWFLGMLVPVSGLVQVGFQSRADRYTYLPYIGLGLMLAWGVPALLAKRLGCPGTAKAAKGPGKWHWCLGAMEAMALACCWLGAHAQLGYWQDDVALFQHVIQVTHQNPVAQNALGVTLAQKGKLEEAAAQYQAALRAGPEYAKFQPEVYKNLGRLYAQQHKLDEAIAMFSEALKLEPNFVAARMCLGLAYRSKGELGKAIPELKLAAAQAPGDMGLQGQLTGTLVKVGQVGEALAHCQGLVARRPEEPAAWFMLAGVYISLNRPEEAIRCIREALRLAPKTPAYYDHLARLLATCPEARLRNGAEAIALAERACTLTRHQNAGFLDTLSAAYAEAGRFAQAIRTAEEARTVALAHQDQEGAQEAARKLELYRVGKPYRERPSAD